MGGWHLALELRNGIPTKARNNDGEGFAGCAPMARPRRNWSRRLSCPCYILGRRYFAWRCALHTQLLEQHIRELVFNDNDGGNGHDRYTTQSYDGVYIENLPALRHVDSPSVPHRAASIVPKSTISSSRRRNRTAARYLVYTPAVQNIDSPGGLHRAASVVPKSTLSSCLGHRTGATVSIDATTPTTMVPPAVDGDGGSDGERHALTHIKMPTWVSGG
ncbi:Uu.00g114100.m01.CDS01 [Anthostomella pinea]|uniref:Uu.00g114100.m01.CDS01 n=1 Tax=Anthostomella pinea TaxID=933095 RepID=A0AAI8VGA5_9PEZI|nr:Uu.00g114100.m01.CDS01 [Anthostomella pinea]